NHYPQPRIDRKKWRVVGGGGAGRPPGGGPDHPLHVGGGGGAPPRGGARARRGGACPPRQRGGGGRAGGRAAGGGGAAPRARAGGVKKGAVDVIWEGADAGDPKKDGAPPPPVAFARSLPLAKALRPEVMLAWGMNGEELPAEHGFPVRAVVGGWYGMASVKWLT